MIPVYCIQFLALVLITKWLSHCEAQSELAIRLTTSPNRVTAGLFLLPQILRGGEHRLTGLYPQNHVH